MPLLERNRLKQSITITAIIIVGIFLLISLWDFTSAFLGAVIFYILFSRFTNFLIQKKKIKRIWAVIITLLISFLVILIPVLSLTWLVAYKISSIISGSEDLYYYIHLLNEFIRTKLGFDLFTTKTLEDLRASITTIIPGLLGETFNITINILLMYFILFYLLDSETDMEKKVLEALPYQRENAKLFTKELLAQTYANAIGAPLLAFVQGCLATLGFWLFGIKDPLFWGIICGLISFLPLLGTPLIWAPAGVYLISTGDHWNGTGLLLYGALIIVGFDHLFRLTIQKKMAQVHPIITLFGIIVGVHWFGIPGFIFGPLLISYFLIMIRVYKSEYGLKSLSAHEEKATN